MYKLITILLMATASTGAWAQGYDPSSGDRPNGLTVMLASGKVELEDAPGGADESINSVIVNFDLPDAPASFELRYSNVQQDDVYSLTTTVNDEVTDRYSVDGKIDNWGIAGKLDLSWSCTDSCLYLMAGFNNGKLTLDATHNGDKAGSYTTDANYAHWGIGFRHDFASNLRATIEYLSYDMGKQELDSPEELGLSAAELDLGTATAWQAGIGYRF